LLFPLPAIADNGWGYLKFPEGEFGLSERSEAIQIAASYTLPVGTSLAKQGDELRATFSIVGEK